MTTKTTSLSVGIRRILKLADFVETKPKHRFDFSHIVGDDWGGLVDLSCGTTACALGWATAMPFFRRLGLYLGRSKTVMLGNEVNWDKIGEQIFGLGKDNEAIMYSLFQPRTFLMDEDTYFHWPTETQFPYLLEGATPKQWAKHARKVAAMLQKQLK